MAFSNLHHNSAAFRLCVDQTDGGHLSGTVCGQRLTQPLLFSDAGGLLLQLDSVLDKQNFPQAYQRTRSFTGKEGDVPASSDPADGMNPEAVAAARGALATLDLYVMSRRNATWQGRVDWLDGTSTDFSSALELIRLLEERLG